GLGASTVHLAYATVAGLGLSLLATFLTEQRAFVFLLGGLFLCYLGAKHFRSKPTAGTDRKTEESLLLVYSSMVLVTLTNPLTILKFLALITGSGLGSGMDLASFLGVALGVFLGSASWWFVLSLGVSCLRGILTPPRLVWVNRVSGIVI